MVPSGAAATVVGLLMIGGRPYTFASNSSGTWMAACAAWRRAGVRRGVVGIWSTGMLPECPSDIGGGVPVLLPTLPTKEPIGPFRTGVPSPLIMTTSFGRIDIWADADRAAVNTVRVNVRMMVRMAVGTE